jgi:hypothetical protein
VRLGKEGPEARRGGTTGSGGRPAVGEETREGKREERGGADVRAPGVGEKGKKGRTWAREKGKKGRTWAHVRSFSSLFFFSFSFLHSNYSNKSI